MPGDLECRQVKKRKGGCSGRAGEERLAERARGQGVVQSVGSRCNPLRDKCTQLPMVYFWKLAVRGYYGNYRPTGR